MFARATKNHQRTLKFPVRKRGCPGEGQNPRTAEPTGLSREAIAKALAEDRVRILVQPQVDLTSNEIRGIETLVRIETEDGRMIGPGQFIDVAEKSGQIRPLGRRIFELACNAACRLAAMGRNDLRVAINLSVVQLADPQEVDCLLEILRLSGAAPQQLEIELTESAAIRSFALVHAQLQRFRALGISIAIDDFGTGFCSLSYLLELDVDRIKIDRLFIAAIDRGRYANLADTVIHLGKSLALDVIAEGVETEAEARWLRRHHCPTAQGFLFYEPLPLDALFSVLEPGESPEAPSAGYAETVPAPPLAAPRRPAPTPLPAMLLR